MGQDTDGVWAASGQIVSVRRVKRLCSSSVPCTQAHAEHLLIGSMNPHLIPFLCAPNLSCLIAYRKKTEQSCRFPSIYQWGGQTVVFWWREKKKVCQPLASTMLRHTVPKIEKKDKIFILFDIVNQKCDLFYYRGNSAHFLFYAALFKMSLTPLSFPFHHNLCFDQLAWDLHLCWSHCLMTSQHYKSSIASPVSSWILMRLKWSAQSKGAGGSLANILALFK